MSDPTLETSVVVLLGRRAGVKTDFSALRYLLGRLDEMNDDRELDRTLQRLRRKGVVAFDRETGWRLVGGGR